MVRIIGSTLIVNGALFYGINFCQVLCSKYRTYSNFLIAVGSLGYALVQRGVNELDETAEVFWRLEEKKYYSKI